MNKTDKIEKPEIKFADLKLCADWIYKKETTRQTTEQYKEGYMDALYDMAATLGIDEELADYEEVLQDK